MRTITVAEAMQGLAGVIDAAAREPVIIRRQSRDVAVVMSIQEYERLTRLNKAEFQRFCDAVGEKAARAGLTEARVAELLDDNE